MSLPIDDLLHDLVTRDASDLHLKAGQAEHVLATGKHWSGIPSDSSPNQNDRATWTS